MRMGAGCAVQRAGCIFSLVAWFGVEGLPLWTYVQSVAVDPWNGCRKNNVVVIVGE